MQLIVIWFLVEREFRNGFPFFLSHIYQVFVTNNLTNICHYFDLLDEIHTKIKRFSPRLSSFHV